MNRIKSILSELEIMNFSDARFLENHILRLENVIAVRELELLELKGPCSNRMCHLHYSHSGPCDCT